MLWSWNNSWLGPKSEGVCLAETGRKSKLKATVTFFKDISKPQLRNESPSTLRSLMECDWTAAASHSQVWCVVCTSGAQITQCCRRGPCTQSLLQWRESFAPVLHQTAIVLEQNETVCVCHKHSRGRKGREGPTTFVFQQSLPPPSPWTAAAQWHRFLLTSHCCHKGPADAECVSLTARGIRLIFDNRQEPTWMWAVFL